MINKRTVTISGSFIRHMDIISKDMDEFTNLNYIILSPITSKIVKEMEDFLYVKGNIIDNVRLTQDKHLNAIYNSDFLWLICPDGKPGQSACLEIGYAIAMNKKIYSKDFICDRTLIEYVHKVNNILLTIKRKLIIS